MPQQIIQYKVLIRQGVDQLNKYMDLNDEVDEWEKRISLTKYGKL